MGCLHSLLLFTGWSQRVNMPLKYLEDWLQCMGGVLDVAGEPVTSARDIPKPPIKLATYDKRFIDSVTATIARGVGLTDKQILAAVNIVTKYKRQWANHDLDPSYLADDALDIPLRLPIREIDRSVSIVRENKSLRLRFPYNSELINQFHSMRGHAAGDWEYDRDGKSWIIDMTEGNVHSLVMLSGFNKIEWSFPDKDVLDLIELAKACVAEPMGLPIVDMVDDKLTYDRVAQSAMESINRSNTDGMNILIDILVAQRHGLSLGPNIIERYSNDHAVSMLLGIESADQTNRYLGRQQLKHLMGLLPQAEFTFQIKNRRARDNILDTALELSNEVTYVERLNELNGIEMYDPKKNIICMDIGLIPANHPTDCNKFLGVLHINSDDGK